MKKYISCLLVLLALALPMLGMEAAAAETVDSGTCGENVTWELDNKGTLTVSGMGDMEDYWVSGWYECRTKIRSAVIEDGITSIGDNAFAGCDNMISISIPDSVTSIGDDAFQNCSCLIKVEITDIAAWCRIDFKDYDSNPLYYAVRGLYVNGKLITEIVFPDSVTSIGDYTFSGCDSLIRITIPDSVTSIGSYAFDNCDSLSNITILDSVTAIGEFAFYDCDSLTSITIPDSVTSIGMCAFENCDSLIGITLPDGITSIDSCVFRYCNSLTSITIPNNVIIINGWAFSSCESLTSITLPENVIFVNSGAFYRCYSLTTVHYTGSEEQAADIVIGGDNEMLKIAAWHYECTGDNCPNPFVDVVADAYYAEPVRWAVNNGITNGLSENTFGPDATCTRGQIVTFLWRANGSPEPESSTNPFGDVMQNDYFYKAVLWAVENGITSGMGDGSFAPGAPCTRGQVATFLWRACGQPAPGGTNIFTDIAPGAYYYDAVLWAVENGITNGMGDGTFAPDAPCTRGQIVTFLYRAMQ